MSGSGVTIRFIVPEPRSSMGNCYGVTLIRGEDRWRALHLELCQAAEEGNLVAVKTLVSRGANIHTQCPVTSVTEFGGGQVGWTALHYAAKNNSLHIIEFLCSHGATNHQTTRCTRLRHMPFGGSTPLHVAAYYGHAHAVKALMEHAQADVNARDEDMATALHLAVMRGNREVVKKLISRREIDLNAEDATGTTPLHLCATKKSLDLAKDLLRAGAEVSFQDKGGRTALHWAVSNGSFDLAEILIEKGANIEAVTLEGATPLIVAAQNETPYIVGRLLQHGADPNRQDKQGNTAIHHVMMRAHSQAMLNHMKPLIDWGADEYMRNSSGATACLYLRPYTMKEYKAVLKARYFPAFMVLTIAAKRMDNLTDETFAAIQKCIEYAPSKDRGGSQKDVVEDCQTRLLDETGDLSVLPSDILILIANKLQNVYVKRVSGKGSENPERRELNILS